MSIPILHQYLFVCIVAFTGGFCQASTVMGVNVMTENVALLLNFVRRIADVRQEAGVPLQAALLIAAHEAGLPMAEVQAMLGIPASTLRRYRAQLHARSKLNTHYTTNSPDRDRKTETPETKPKTQTPQTSEGIDHPAPLAQMPPENEPPTPTVRSKSRVSPEADFLAGIYAPHIPTTTPAALAVVIDHVQRATPGIAATDLHQATMLAALNTEAAVKAGRIWPNAQPLNWFATVLTRMATRSHARAQRADTAPAAPGRPSSNVFLRRDPKPADYYTVANSFG